MTLPAIRPAASWAAALVGLTTFALAQPLLSVLADNATFFVVHGAGTGDIVRFALLVYLLPPLVIGVVAGLVAVFSRRAGRILVTGVGAVLGGVAVLALAPPSLRDHTLVYVIVFVAAAALMGWALATTSWMKKFWTAMGIISPITIIFFLWFSPAADIVFPDDVDIADAAPATSDSPDVVVVVLDELALARTLGADGELDQAKVPNLARLAEIGTHYRDTTTISKSTKTAVPAILSGQIPGLGRLPLASQYPQNLFTMLAPTHRVVADESVTRLCPAVLCPEGEHSPLSEVAADARVVYGHTLLPTSWAQDWLPDVADRWAGFGDKLPDGFFSQFKKDEAFDQAGRMTALIDSITTSTEPALHYLHLALPHLPYRYLPDGRGYLDSNINGLHEGEWVEDAAVTDVAAHRYQLQLAFTDSEIGRLLDALENSGRMDDTMLVVVADHGSAFMPGRPSRTPTRDNIGDIAWVPLFIKYPGQTDGQTVDDPVETIDIFPTVADTLGIELDDVDGRVLTNTTEPTQPRALIEEPDWPLDFDQELGPAVGRALALLPEDTDPERSYGLDALRGQTGRPLDAFDIGNRHRGRIRVRRPQNYVAVALDGGPVPAMFRADVRNLDSGAHVAIGLNGRLAGSGLVTSEESLLLTMLDPTVLVEGTNELSAYLVDGTRLRPMRVTGAATNSS